MREKLRYVTEAREARQRVDALTREPVLGVDIETTGLDPHRDRVRLVSVAALNGRVAVFDMFYLPWDTLKPLSTRPWAVFNGSFEYRHLTKHLPIPALHDLQLLDRLASHRMHRTLAEAVKDTLGLELDKSAQTSDWSGALSQAQIHYAGLDALATVRTAEKLIRQIQHAGQRTLYDTWRQALPVLAQLELDGLSFDFEQHRRLVEGWQQEKDKLYRELLEHLGPTVSPTSGPQIGHWLEKNLPASLVKKWPKTGTGRLKTDADTLALFGNLPLIAPLLRFKKVCKLLNTYGESYIQHRHPMTGRFNPTFKLGQTVSGRICTSNPNVQNPPRMDSFRALFTASQGKVLIGADYSQIELRVAALLSGDTAMLEAYRRGEDLHQLTAAAIAGVPLEHVTKEQRTAAKAVNFGNLYGQGPAGLAKTATISYGASMTAAQAKAALTKFHLAYPQLAAWKRQQIGLGRQYRQVKTRLGLIRDFDAQGEGYLNGEACNIPIQGSAAEVLVTTLSRLPLKLAGLEARLYHTIHDELLLEAAPDHAEAAAAALQAAMVEGFLAVFPEAESLTQDLVAVRIGTNWAEVH
jgi:DNA polymerase I